MSKKALKNYALITGASSGMGFEYSKLLAQRGYNLIMVALFQNETDAAASSIKESFPDVNIISLGIDLSKMDAPELLFNKVKESIGDAMVEVLINNAGVLFPKHFKNMTAAQVSKITMIHNHTLSMLCYYFLPSMIEHNLGYILNISSLAAWIHYPFITMYSATKAYTRALTRAMRIELRGSGVNVCTIYFGAVSTNLYKLSDKWRKIAKNLSVMLSPHKAASIALKMMFRGRSGRIPGIINIISLGIIALIPSCLISSIEKRVSKKWNLE